MQYLVKMLDFKKKKIKCIQWQYLKKSLLDVMVPH